MCAHTLGDSPRANHFLMFSFLVLLGSKVIYIWHPQFAGKRATVFKRLILASRSWLIFWHVVILTAQTIVTSQPLTWGLRAALGPQHTARQGSTSPGGLCHTSPISVVGAVLPRQSAGRRLPSLGLQEENFKGRREHGRRGCLVESST